MKYWITKYALTSGVLVVENFTQDQRTRSMISGGRYHYHTPDWHETEDAALTRVVTMVELRKRAIERESDKLDSIQRELSAGTLPMQKPRKS